MAKKDAFPMTPAIRFLREHPVEFTICEYPYQEHGGTALTAEFFNVPEHQVIKTIVLENENKKGPTGPLSISIWCWVICGSYCREFHERQINISAHAF